MLRLPQAEAARIVFVQYLVGLAVVEAITAQPGLDKLGIRLKWPNDVYADFGDQVPGKRYRKIGGILINSSFRDGVFSLVAGACSSRAFLSSADVVDSEVPVRVRRQRQQPEANDVGE